MTIQGLHHITLVTRDAQQNVDFYTRVLGLRMIKKTVNFDDPGSYHLYYGDGVGSLGTAVTFFEWPHVGKGSYGIGGTHHFALTVPDYDGLLKWKRRLTDLNIRVHGPYNRLYFQSIYFKDPDGTQLEIATAGPGFTVDEAPDELGTHQLAPPDEMIRANRDEEHIKTITWSEPVPHVTSDMALMHGMHHISAMSSNIERTHEFFGELLGMRRIKQTLNFDMPESSHWYWGVGEGKPGTVLTYFGYPPGRAPMVQHGAGQTHHYALIVPDEDSQLEWREKLIQAGHQVSPVMERIYFKSIYTRDPDGHIVELATAGPGFLVDEDENELGGSLRLPPWYEQHRTEIENALKPITAEPWRVPQA